MGAAMPKVLVLPETVAVCQGTVPALAATALLCAEDDAAAPRSLTLFAGPIDPSAKRTLVVLACRERGSEWFRRNAIGTVAGAYPGAGRRIYPATAQLATCPGTCRGIGCREGPFGSYGRTTAKTPCAFRLPAF
jgi:poly-beta-hydroxyalkanoate depolymerase